MGIDENHNQNDHNCDRNQVYPIGYEDPNDLKTQNRNSLIQLQSANNEPNLKVTVYFTHFQSTPKQDEPDEEPISKNKTDNVIHKGIQKVLKAPKKVEIISYITYYLQGSRVPAQRRRKAEQADVQADPEEECDDSEPDKG